MSVFTALDVYLDESSRSAATNMAIDEALLELATVPSVRFYRWDHRALSFGYFGRIADVAEHNDRDLVRRWTGGGIVLHGDDLTYSLTIPAKDPAFSESSMSIYENVHRAIQNALAQDNQKAELVSSVAAVSDRRNQSDSEVGDRRYNENACFANPVRADVMMNGKKIAGAAQRRTRHGLLQQGSIQGVDLANEFEKRLANEMSGDPIVRKLDGTVLGRAEEIAAQKYATHAWLHRR